MKRFFAKYAFIRGEEVHTTELASYFRWLKSRRVALTHRSYKDARLARHTYDKGTYIKTPPEFLSARIWGNFSKEEGFSFCCQS